MAACNIPADACLSFVVLQSKVTPPVPALHRLLSLCSSEAPDSDNLTKVRDS